MTHVPVIRLQFIEPLMTRMVPAEISLDPSLPAIRRRAALVREFEGLLDDIPAEWWAS